VAVISFRNLILACAAVPLIYYAAATVCAWAFFRNREELPSDFTPPLSVLKPMHGTYRDTYGNLASFCRQDYPEYELLFGVNSADDPAIAVIRRLVAEFPGLPIRSAIGTSPIKLRPTYSGSNDKVVKLCRLEQEARYDLLVASDGDIRVEPNYLRRVAAAFRDSRVGVVTSLYRGNTEPNLWSELEDLSLTTDFLAGVLVARKLGLKFALGATMAARREALAAIGGFESLVNAAADDHELGRRAAAHGFALGFAETVPETECSTHNLRSYFRHHLRWAVVTRTSQLWGHVGFLFAHGLPWAILAVILAPSWMTAAGFAAAYLVLRMGLAFVLGSWGLRDPLVRKKWWLVPFRDALAFVIWFASLFATRVHWQDAAYDVRHGRLIPATGRPVTVPERVSNNS
jgi:ceramide glucosyltransferase